MLEKKIQDDLKAAMKEGRKVEVSSLRMLINAIKNRRIDLRVDSLEDAEVLSIVKKLGKQHNESIEQFRGAGRMDLVEKESAELDALKRYLPEEMTVSEVTRIVDESIKALGLSSPRDMGAVMKDVLDKIKGRADGKVVSQIVKEKLAK